MRDVSRKIDTTRTATAQATLKIGPAGLKALKEGTLPKGEPFGVVQAAGMLAAKRTSELIPHCHNLPLDSLTIDCQVVEGGCTITAAARTVWKTGVEMEALTAASIAALTLYDLLKPVESELSISETKLVSKQGGKSQFGTYFADFKPRFAVLVSSDRASDGTYQDKSGERIIQLVEAEGGIKADYTVLPDEQGQLESKLKEWVKAGDIPLIFTTGGTGIATRDVMVEATHEVIEREVPGIAEAMRGYSQRRKPLAMFTRGVAGASGRSLIVNLPGSTKGVEECLEAILPFVFHAAEQLKDAQIPSFAPKVTTAAPQVATPAGAIYENLPPPAPAVTSTPQQVQPSATPAGYAPAPPITAATPTPMAQPRFDPNTGAPLAPQAAPTPRFDPNTGQPITGPMTPVQQPSYTPPPPAPSYGAPPPPPAPAYGAPPPAPPMAAPPAYAPPAPPPTEDTAEFPAIPPPLG